jgi:hypothetical protein
LGDIFATYLVGIGQSLAICERGGGGACRHFEERVLIVEDEAMLSLDSAPMFHSSVNWWGATDVVPELADSSPALAVPVNPPTSLESVPTITFFDVFRTIARCGFGYNQNIVRVCESVRLIAARA